MNLFPLIHKLTLKIRLSTFEAMPLCCLVTSQRSRRNDEVNPTNSFTLAAGPRLAGFLTSSNDPHPGNLNFYSSSLPSLSPHDKFLLHCRLISANNTADGVLDEQKNATTLPNRKIKNQRNKFKILMVFNTINIQLV